MTTTKVAAAQQPKSKRASPAGQFLDDLVRKHPSLTLPIVLPVMVAEETVAAIPEIGRGLAYVAKEVVGYFRDSYR